MKKQNKDEKLIWYTKGLSACVREFSWRLKFLFEKDEKYWRILEVIDKLKDEK